MIEEEKMGRNLGSSFSKELTNLEKDSDTHKAAMSNLRSIVKDLDSNLIHLFVTQVSETNEIGSESGGYTVSLFEDLARAHGVNIAPYVEIIMPVIIRTLSSSEGSLSVQQACSKAVAAMARYGIDPATPEDKRTNVIHALCKPLSDSLLDTQHQQHLALGSSLCLKSLVDCNNWRFASGEMVNNVCQSLAVALEATSSEAMSHMALVMALAKHNPFTVEAYARLLVKSGLRILELGVVEGDSQKQVLAIQMLNVLMKTLNPKSICSELELIYREMEKHQKDQVHHVKMAACETMGIAERLIREADSLLNDENCKSTPSLRPHDLRSIDESYVNVQVDEEDVLFSGMASRRSVVSSSSPLVTYDGYIQETGLVVENPRSRIQSRTSRSRSSRRNTKKKQSQDNSLEQDRHGFKQDSFNELLENRQKLQQTNECLSSSSSSIHDTSGTITPTITMEEEIYEKPKSDLVVETKLKTRESYTDSGQVKNKSVLRLGLSFFSVVVVVASSFIWMHLEDDMIPPHLVPT